MGILENLRTRNASIEEKIALREKHIAQIDFEIAKLQRIRTKVKSELEQLRKLR